MQKKVFSFILSLSLVIGIVFATPSRVSADGCTFPSTSAANLDVLATRQRALVWLRDGTWEVHIQPVFEREEGAAAWVVPFPSLPQIHEGSPELLHQLEIITSPVFIELCTVPSSQQTNGCLYSGMKLDDEQGRQKSAHTTVTLWDHGRVGELDYVVLSAEDGDDLVNWLIMRGYHIPEEAVEMIAGFETEGQFFFVAQLAEDADPEKAEAPVRFVLPEEDDGFYPLRLTSLAVEGDERLALTLFLVFPEENEDGFLPDSHPYEKFDSRPLDREEFDAQKENFFAEHTSDTLLLLFGRHLSRSDALQKERCAFSEHSLYGCVSYDQMNIDVPGVWHEDIGEMESSESWLYRFEAHLDSSALSNDILLGPVDTQDLPIHTNLYTKHIGTCESESKEDEYVGCSFHKRDVPSDWFIILLLILAGLYGVRKL